MGAAQTSGEVQVLILDKLRGQDASIQSLTTAINNMALLLNDGKHTMGSHSQRIEQHAKDHIELSRTVDGLDTRVGAVEAAIAAARAADEAKAAARREQDDASDWRAPGKHRALQREVKTETIRRMDLTPWIKYGSLIGAAVAGAYAAVKVGSP
jgi:septal ring factor EnvC (AmiA/AmiB activator)